MGIYCIVAGTALGLFEFPFPIYRKIPLFSKVWTNYLIRGIIYFVGAIACYSVGIGIIGGVLTTLLSVMYIFVWIKGESAEDPTETIEYDQISDSVVDVYHRAKGDGEGSEDSDSEELD